MKEISELYINNQKVYFTNPPEVFLNYTHTDLHNPTIVKNSYSKTITIEGMPENNNIFNRFYDLQRVNGENIFNASRKETFKLYVNGEIKETGYVKLDKVNRRGGQISYDVTLYGGLGQFLYNLKFREDGEQMKLSDLEYGVDFDFEVNKEVVKDAWLKITGINENVENADMYDIINFAPCYNGIPEDFAADKVAININSFAADYDGDGNYEGNSPSLRKQFESTDKNYKDIDGWIIAELAKEYDEWQMKDLRSYLQRPVIRYKTIIDACCNPDNNGGWQVDLDPDFFNADNPYYENAWMTLPKVTEMEVEGYDVTNVGISSVEGDRINISGATEGMTATYTFKIGFGCSADSSESSLRTYNSISSWDGSDESSPVDESTNVARYVQVLCCDADGNVIGGSSVNSFYTSNPMSDDFGYSPEYRTSINKYDGTYVKQSDGTYLFGNKYYDFELKHIEYQEGMYFKIVEKYAYSQSGRVEPSKDELYYSVYLGYDDDSGQDIYKTSSVPAYNFYNEVATNTEIAKLSKGEKRVNKNTLLNSKNTPCDYFLSYLKLFNLHIWKDTFEDIIHIRLRKNYFTGTVKDIDVDVDRDKNMKITPITFENKWLNFNNELCDTGFAKEYLDNYGINYGIHKVDTNYNFDTSSKDLFEDNVFKGTIQIRNKSRYYVNLWQSYEDSDVLYPPFMLDGLQPFFFNSKGDTAEGKYITPKVTTDNVNWWKEKYYDILPKPLFADADNKPVDGANVLLFYNGKEEMRDNEGYRMKFQITDDIPQFQQLNEGEPCWIWSEDWDNSIDYLDYFPCFSRYITNENGWVTHSWDFGTPKVLYLPEVSIDSTSNLYTQYWQSYMRDQYDINTRKVECNVRLYNPVFIDVLRDFYYFEGRIWVLNSVIDYNPSSYDTTKCEFVSVNEKANYLQ